tara:strand:+ start:2832 stop:3809 length:978 start_codon:yes stop_codon:yes gene_type:complete
MYFEVNNFDKNGFTIVEAVVVLSVISALSAISIPSIISTVALNEVDQIKALMSSFAAECLNDFRLGNDISLINPATNSKDKINQLGYKIDSSYNSCSHLILSPTKQLSIKYEIDFRIGSESGKIIKSAQKPSDSKALKSCQMWAGSNCGASTSQKAIWTSELLLEKQKNDCETQFFNWKNSQPSGSKNRWNSTSNNCSKLTWVHKNYIAETEAEYEAIKNTEACISEKNKYSTYTGEKYITECSKTFYFFKGIDLGSKNQMEAKLIEEEEASCKVKQESQRLTASNGKVVGEVAAGSCGDSYWICNKRILSSIDQWKESECFSGG